MVDVDRTAGRELDANVCVGIISKAIKIMLNNRLDFINTKPRDR